MFNINFSRFSWKFCVTNMGVFLLAGCATQTISVAPDARPIKIFSQQGEYVNSSGEIRNIQPLANCAVLQRKGEVLARTTQPGFQNDRSITLNEQNAIKNQALVLGANNVVITHNSVIYNGRESTHFIKGEAYLCGEFPSTPLIK